MSSEEERPPRWWNAGLAAWFRCALRVAADGCCDGATSPSGGGKKSNADRSKPEFPSDLHSLLLFLERLCWKSAKHHLTLEAHQKVLSNKRPKLEMMKKKLIHTISTCPLKQHGNTREVIDCDPLKDLWMWHVSSRSHQGAQTHILRLTGEPEECKVFGYMR